MVNSKKIYWGLIITFGLLYFFVAFVSFLHAIEFFGLANNRMLSIMLASAYEVGQSAVLFSILMTQNKHRFMAWSMMILLTSLQVTANVFASFKFMDLAIAAGDIDWTYWQRAIMFWVEADSPEMYKIAISWIIGALLPIVALGMTALVADNIKLMTGDVDLDTDDYEDDYEDEKNDKIIPQGGGPNLTPSRDEEPTKEIFNVNISEDASEESLRELRKKYKEEISFDDDGAPTEEYAIAQKSSPWEASPEHHTAARVDALGEYVEDTANDERTMEMPEKIPFGATQFKSPGVFVRKPPESDPTYIAEDAAQINPDFDAHSTDTATDFEDIQNMDMDDIIGSSVGETDRPETERPKYDELVIPKSSQSIVDSIPDAGEPTLTPNDIRNMDEGVEVIDVKAISRKGDK